MEKITRLEELKAWVEARRLAKVLFELANKLPKEENYSIKAHLKENGRHIPANIAEGFSRFYLRDSLQLYRVALGSLGESKTDVYLCFDREYITKGELEIHLKQISLVERLISGLIASAKKVKPIR